MSNNFKCIYIFKEKTEHVIWRPSGTKKNHPQMIKVIFSVFKANVFYAMICLHWPEMLKDNDNGQQTDSDQKTNPMNLCII